MITLTKILTSLIIITSLIDESSGKLQSCREKFKEQDWIYCTKFGVPPTGMVFATIRAKLTTQYKKSDDYVTVQVGQYSDTVWDRISDNYGMKCSEKRDLAQQNNLRTFNVHLNGAWTHH
jgi:hypothetical protein